MTARRSMQRRPMDKGRLSDARVPKLDLIKVARWVRERGRVALDDQVLSQAPSGAVGYRLVLPVRDVGESPRIVPDATRNGALPYWRLHPFELPDDLRLRSGRLYRLLWVDARGALLPPDGNRFLPALRFFLGPPDAEQTLPRATMNNPVRIRRRQRESGPHTDASHPGGHSAERVTARPAPAISEAASPGMTPGSLVSTHEDASAPGRVAAGTDVAAAPDQEISAMVHAAETEWRLHPSPEADDEGAPVEPSTTVELDVSASSAASPPAQPPTSERESAAPTPAVASTSSDSATPAVGAQAKGSEEESGFPVVESAEQHADVDLLPPAESVAVAGAPAAQLASFDVSAIVPECSPPLSPQEIRTLIGIVLHTEKCAALQHEIDCVHARARDLPPPSSPEFELRDEERAQIRSVVHDARLATAAIRLYAAWLHFHAQGPVAMARLPAPFVSLTFADAERITSVLNSPPRRAYAEYVLARVTALLQGKPEPAPPTSDLSPKVRRHIRQLFTDARLVVLMQHGIWTRDGLAVLKAGRA